MGFVGRKLNETKELRLSKPKLGIEGRMRRCCTARYNYIQGSRLNRSILCMIV